MHERHNTKIAVFGGKPGERLEYKGKCQNPETFLVLNMYVDAQLFEGMAGNQVLEWADLNSEILTAGVKNVRLSGNNCEVVLRMLTFFYLQNSLSPPDL
jgi:hypothetical protein